MWSTDSGRAWPLWLAPVGLLLAFGATLFVTSLLTAAYVASGGHADDPLPPALLALATVAQDAIFIGVAVGLITLVQRPWSRALGLRHAPLRAVCGWTLTAAAAFYAFSLGYEAIVQPDGEQDILERLGAAQGTQYVVAAAVLVVVLAPIAEEVFFRGFVYGALRTQIRPAAASALVGLLFGAVHYSGTGTLELLPVLAVLGFLFCQLYERSGTLYAPIALHVLNNAVALGTADGVPMAAPVAIISGTAMLLTLGILTRPRRALEKTATG